MSGLIRWWRIYSPFGHRLASSAACVQSILRATLTHAANPRKTADRSLASLDGVSFIRRAIDFTRIAKRVILSQGANHAQQKFHLSKLLVEQVLNLPIWQ
jgi:hypothetical protein